MKTKQIEGYGRGSFLYNNHNTMRQSKKKWKTPSSNYYPNEENVH